jgi:hypothetical protein
MQHNGKYIFTALGSGSLLVSVLICMCAAETERVKGT